MENNLNQPTLVPYAVLKGFLVGIIGAILVLTVYLLDYTLLANWAFSLITLVFLTGLVIYFGIQYRKSGPGYLSFGKSFQLALIIYLASGLVQTVFNILLYHVIDPELPLLITEEAVGNMESLFRSMGMAQEQIDEQVHKLKEEMPEQFSVASQLKYSWIILIVSTIFALIVGAIIKRNEPIIENN